jgi:hypothetical protein
MNILNDYAKLRVKLAKLEVEKKKMESEIIEEFKNLNEKTVEIKGGKITLSERKKYIYSDSVIKKEEQLEKKKEELLSQLSPLKDDIEILKHKEEKKGVAKCDIGYSVSFKANKK